MYTEKEKRNAAASSRHVGWLTDRRPPPHRRVARAPRRRCSCRRSCSLLLALRSRITCEKVAAQAIEAVSVGGWHAVPLPPNEPACAPLAPSGSHQQAHKDGREIDKQVLRQTSMEGATSQRSALCCGRRAGGGGARRLQLPAAAHQGVAQRVAVPGLAALHDQLRVVDHVPAAATKSKGKGQGGRHDACSRCGERHRGGCGRQAPGRHTACPGPAAVRGAWGGAQRHRHPRRNHPAAAGAGAAPAAASLAPPRTR